MASPAAPMPEAFLFYEESPRTPDYYAILGLGQDATSEEIGEAIAARRPAETQEDFVLIDPVAQAEIVLLDKTKRQIYDSVFDVILLIHEDFVKGLLGDMNYPYTIDAVLAEFVADIRRGKITEVPAPTYCALREGFGEMTEKDFGSCSGVCCAHRGGE